MTLTAPLPFLSLPFPQQLLTNCIYLVPDLELYLPSLVAVLILLTSGITTAILADMFVGEFLIYASLVVPAYLLFLFLAIIRSPVSAPTMRQVAPISLYGGNPNEFELPEETSLHPTHAHAFPTTSGKFLPHQQQQPQQQQQQHHQQQQNSFIHHSSSSLHDVESESESDYAPDISINALLDDDYDRPLPAPPTPPTIPAATLLGSTPIRFHLPVNTSPQLHNRSAQLPPPQQQQQQQLPPPQQQQQQPQQHQLTPLGVSPSPSFSSIPTPNQLQSTSIRSDPNGLLTATTSLSSSTLKPSQLLSSEPHHNSSSAYTQHQHTLTTGSNDDIAVLQSLYMPNFCYSCHKSYASRAYHCSTCRTCVPLLHHHSHLLHICISQHNFALYIHFLFTLLFSILSIGIIVIYYFFYYQAPYNVPPPSFTHSPFVLAYFGLVLSIGFQSVVYYLGQVFTTLYYNLTQHERALIINTFESYDAIGNGNTPLHNTKPGGFNSSVIPQNTSTNTTTPMTAGSSSWQSQSDVVSTREQSIGLLFRLREQHLHEITSHRTIRGAMAAFFSISASFEDFRQSCCGFFSVSSASRHTTTTTTNVAGGSGSATASNFQIGSIDEENGLPQRVPSSSQTQHQRPVSCDPGTVTACVQCQSILIWLPSFLGIVLTAPSWTLLQGIVNCFESLF